MVYFLHKEMLKEKKSEMLINLLSRDNKLIDHLFQMAFQIFPNGKASEVIFTPAICISDSSRASIRVCTTYY